MPYAPVNDESTKDRCFGCGYGLEGLPAPVAKCPECGRLNPAAGAPPLPRWFKIAFLIWPPLLLACQLGGWCAFRSKISEDGAERFALIIAMLMLLAWPAAVITFFLLLMIDDRIRLPLYKRRWYLAVKNIAIAGVIGSLVYAICTLVGFQVARFL